MKLKELEATFIGHYSDTGKVTYSELPNIEGAQGVLFICPKCQNHLVLCWFKNPRNAPPVPANAFPFPGRWDFSGETIDALTLTPSVDLSKIDKDNPASPSRCYWHGFVKNGNAE